MRGSNRYITSSMQRFTNLLFILALLVSIQAPSSFNFLFCFDIMTQKWSIHGEAGKKDLVDAEHLSSRHELQKSTQISGLEIFCFDETPLFICKLPSNNNGNRPRNRTFCCDLNGSFSLIYYLHISSTVIKPMIHNAYPAPSSMQADDEQVFFLIQKHLHRIPDNRNRNRSRLLKLV